MTSCWYLWEGWLQSTVRSSVTCQLFGPPQSPKSLNISGHRRCYGYLLFPSILNRNFTINKLTDKVLLKLWLWIRKQNYLIHHVFLPHPCFFASIHPRKLVLKEFQPNQANSKIQNSDSERYPLGFMGKKKKKASVQKRKIQVNTHIEREAVAQSLIY